MSEGRPSKKQRELLSFIDNFISGHGYGPSYREIQNGMGYSSVSTVATHIDNLITKGHLRKRSNSARSLELVKNSKQFTTNIIDAADEKWLIDLIQHKFEELETESSPDKNRIDNLYVLVGALKILGFDGAYVSFRDRLKELSKKSK